MSVPSKKKLVSKTVGEFAAFIEDYSVKELKDVCRKLEVEVALSNVKKEFVRDQAVAQHAKLRRVFLKKKREQEEENLPGPEEKKDPVKGKREKKKDPVKEKREKKKGPVQADRDAQLRKRHVNAVDGVSLTRIDAAAQGDYTVKVTNSEYDHYLKHNLEVPFGNMEDQDVNHIIASSKGGAHHPANFFMANTKFNTMIKGELNGQLEDKTQDNYDAFNCFIVGQAKANHAMMASRQKKNYGKDLVHGENVTGALLYKRGRIIMELFVEYAKTKEFREKYEEGVAGLKF